MSAGSLTARPLAPSNLGAWDRLASAHGSVFDSLRWTSLFDPQLLRVGIFDAGENLRGGFCVWPERRLGLRILRNPPYTPHIGPFYEPRASNPAARTDEQRAVVEAMADFLASNGGAVMSMGLSFCITDWLPFYWRGWKVVPHYTYRIELKQDEKTLLAAMSAKRRNDIRKAGADSVTVEETVDTNAMRGLMLETFARQKMTLDRAATDRIFAGFPPGGGSYCLIARGAGRAVAGVYVVHDARTAYYLIGGYADNAHHGAGALTMWAAILKAKAMGLKVFDFEGSVIPRIERYFRGFGGELTPLVSVNRAWLPLEMALKTRAKFRSRF